MIKNKFKMLVGASHSVIGESPSGNSWLLDNGLSVLKNHEGCSWRWLRLDELESKYLAKTRIPRDCELQADIVNAGQRWRKTRRFPNAPWRVTQQASCAIREWIRRSG